MRQRYRRGILVLIFIVIMNLILLLFNYITEVNAMYDIEESNNFRWQKFMSEDEFNQLEQGMSYKEVVEVAKGRGEPISEGVFVWNDEWVMTMAYEIHFDDGKLLDKKIIEKRGYSTR
ncbi:hypothetical protein ACIQ34_19500 [Ureibacillus sp. NPDC094379]